MAPIVSVEFEHVPQLIEDDPKVTLVAYTRVREPSALAEQLAGFAVTIVQEILILHTLAQATIYVDYSLAGQLS